MDYLKAHWLVSSSQPLCAKNWMTYHQANISSSQELQQDQPQLYDNLTKILTPEEQRIVHDVVIQADAISAATASVVARANGGLHW